jgi:hypothetical protein
MGGKHNKMNKSSNPALDLELKRCFPLSIFHYTLGALLFISGIIAAVSLWPESPFFATKFTGKFLDYLPSLLSFIGGSFFCILLCTVARFLSLIHIQNIMMRHIANELDRQGFELDRERERMVRNIEMTKPYMAPPHE